MVPIVLAGLLAYALGCLSAGYYLARARGLDLRAAGSGSTGARNAGRLLGKGAFAATFALDLAKGALAVLAAGWVAPGLWGRPLAMVAVVMGHVWPAQLGFRGGKGISPAVGGLLVVSWKLTGLLVLPLLLGWGLARSFKRGGLLAVAVGPPMAWFLRGPLDLTVQECAAFCLLAILIAGTHWVTRQKPVAS